MSDVTRRDALLLGAATLTSVLAPVRPSEIREKRPSSTASRRSEISNIPRTSSSSTM